MKKLKTIRFKFYAGIGFGFWAQDYNSKDFTDQEPHFRSEVDTYLLPFVMIEVCRSYIPEKWLTELGHKKAQKEKI